MSAVSLAHNEITHGKAISRIARLLSPGPTFELRSCSSSGRGQVEQYIFDQFQASHGATICDFLPLFFTMICNDSYIATVGIRPSCGHNLFLEQYLPGPVEKMLGKFTGQCVKREHVVEIGNLVATRRGSSLLLFLILAAVLQQAGFEWFVCTATPQVQKTIRSMGLELFALADADPSVLNVDNQSGWGTYYESQPAVVAGNLSEAMAVAVRRRIYSHLISFYRDRIKSMAFMIKSSS